MSSQHGICANTCPCSSAIQVCCEQSVCVCGGRFLGIQRSQLQSALHGLASHHLWRGLCPAGEVTADEGNRGLHASEQSEKAGSQDINSPSSLPICNAHSWLTCGLLSVQMGRIKEQTRCFTLGTTLRPSCWNVKEQLLECWPAVDIQCYVPMQTIGKDWWAEYTPTEEEVGLLIIASLQARCLHFVFCMFRGRQKTEH